MLKTAISSLSSTLLSTAKETVKSYMPTTETVVSGAFNQIAQNGIANLSYRSPILATLAQSVMQNFQLELIKKKKMQSYVQSKEADWLRPQVKAKMGDKASDAKIEQEMIKILSKMSTAIDKDGVEATKKSGVFKEYEQYFDEFKKSTQESAKQESAQGSAAGVAATGDTAHDSETLNRIEGNTQRTVNVLEVLASHNNITGGGTPGTGTGTGGGSFIDPMTGMPSVTAAMGSIGGSFLGKIFDDKTISKFADKTKELFGLGADANEKKPATVVKENNTADVLNKTSETINTDREKAKVVTPDTKETKHENISNVTTERDRLINREDISNVATDKTKTISIDNTKEVNRDGITKISTENTSESVKEINAENNNQYEKLQKVSEESLTELKKIAVATAKEDKTNESIPEKEKNKEKETVVDKVLNKAKEKIGNTVQARIPKGMPGAGRFVAKALETGKESASYAKKATSGFGAIGQATNVASKALGATGTASAATAAGGMGLGSLALGALAAGVAGVVTGSKVVAPLIDKGISAATGKENSLGGWVYDKMHPEENSASENKSPETKPNLNAKPSTPNVAKLEAAKSPSPNQIASLTETKNQQDISKSSSSSTPQTIVLNNGGGGGSASAPSQPSPAPTGATSIRNQDSTFERVQMQDFWPRIT